MSGILDLAQSFEQKSKAQAEATEKALAKDFQKHEQHIQALLKESESTLSSAIHDLTQNQRKALRWLWISAVVPIIMGVFAALAVIYLVQEIGFKADQLEEVRAAGSEIELTRCGDAKRLCAKIDTSAGAYGKNSEWRILEGY